MSHRWRSPMHDIAPSAASISVQELRAALQTNDAPLVIDVRRPPAFQASTQMIRGALRRDPALVTTWAGSLPSRSSVVVYCVRGHEVSQEAAHALTTCGIAARFLAGGLDA